MRILSCVVCSYKFIEIRSLLVSLPFWNVSSSNYIFKYLRERDCITCVNLFLKSIWKAWAREREREKEREREGGGRRDLFVSRKPKSSAVELFHAPPPWQTAEKDFRKAWRPKVFPPLRFDPTQLSVPRRFIFLYEVERHRFQLSKPIYTCIRRRARMMKSTLAPEEHRTTINVSLASSGVLANLEPSRYLSERIGCLAERG